MRYNFSPSITYFMKIIYDNIAYSLQKAGGITIYWSELIKRIYKNENIIFYENKNDNIFRRSLNILTRKEGIIPFRLSRYLPFLKKLPSKSIFHSSYYRTSLQRDVINIVTVYDFTYEYFRNGLARIMHSWQKNLAIKNADGVICISDSTKRDLFKFLPNVDRKKVRTIHISAGNEFHRITDIEKLKKDSKFKILINKKIILYVGDRRSAYKNFMLAIDVVSSLKDYILVSVGSGEITKDENNNIKNKLQGKFYHFLGISRDELNILYNLSFCLLYPSSYEGFGIPVLEAMKAGCPVISTNSSSIPEVAGDAAILVDNIEQDSFVKSIKYLENKNLRNKLINKGFLQAEKFSWNLCYKQTREFYNEVNNWKSEK